MTKDLLVFGFIIVISIPAFILGEVAIQSHYNAKVQTAILECKVQALKTGNSSQFVERVCTIYPFKLNNK